MNSWPKTRVRFWVEAGIAGLATALMVLTMVNAEWLEWLTGTNPDWGSGALEWSAVAACFFAALVSLTLARREWLRALVPT